MNINWIDFKKLCEIKSWSKGSDISKTALLNRNLNESEINGWTVSLKFQNENEFYELNGSDYVLDLITEIENSPLVLTMNSENTNYLTNKKKTKTITRSSCSTDWYLESVNKFESKNSLGLENSIKGTTNKRCENVLNIQFFVDKIMKQAPANDFSIYAEWYRNITRFNYKISKKEYDELKTNNFYENFETYLNSIGNSVKSKHDMTQNLSDKIKGGSYKDTNIISSSYQMNANKYQQDFADFFNNQTNNKPVFNRIKEKESEISFKTKKSGQAIYKFRVTPE